MTRPRRLWPIRLFPKSFGFPILPDFCRAPEAYFFFAADCPFSCRLKLPNQDSPPPTDRHPPAAFPPTDRHTCARRPGVRKPHGPPTQGPSPPENSSPLPSTPGAPAPVPRTKVEPPAWGPRSVPAIGHATSAPPGSSQLLYVSFVSFATANPSSVAFVPEFSLDWHPLCTRAITFILFVVNLGEEVEIWHQVTPP